MVHPPPGELAGVLRGYDREQARALFNRIRSGAAPSDRAWQELDAVATAWRGYDRHQVKFAVRFLLSLWESGRAPTIPRFDLVIRGYEPEQVDPLFQRIRTAELTAAQAMDQLGDVDDIVQGYDKPEVRFALAELGGTARVGD